MPSDKVFITPGKWGLENDERTSAEYCPEHGPACGWITVASAGGDKVTLHKEEIERLYKFVREGSSDGD